MKDYYGRQIKLLEAQIALAEKGFTANCVEAVDVMQALAEGKGEFDDYSNIVKNLCEDLKAIDDLKDELSTTREQLRRWIGEHLSEVEAV